jgi:hypothetical protein
LFSFKILAADYADQNESGKQEVRKKLA